MEAANEAARRAVNAIIASNPMLRVVSATCGRSARRGM
jgi:hypothetical protein